MSPVPEKIGDLEIILTTGPLFVGILLNYLLAGILIHQLFDYHRDCSNDKWAVKWFVYGVCILDLMQTGFTTQFSWFYCVQNWGNVGVFTNAMFAWTASILPITAGLVAMLVQFFYVWRIWCLGGRWLKACSVLIAMVAFLEFLGALIGGIKYDVLGILGITPSTVPFFEIWLAGSFTCDMLIAGCMTTIFYQLRTRSTFDKTNSILNILIRHVVETAAITALCAGAELILFITTRNVSQAHAVPAFILGKLYTNCLLANLNNRKHLTLSVDSQGSGNAVNSFRLRSFRKKNSNSAIVDLTTIQVDQDCHVTRDDGVSSSSTAHDMERKEFGQDRDRKYTKDDASDTFIYKSETIAGEP